MVKNSTFFSLPNLLTTLNLIGGIFALYYTFHSRFLHAFYFTCLSLLADFLDGFTARLFKQHSEVGKQLDSLADMVSFGVVPAYVMFQFISLLLGTALLPLEKRPLFSLLLNGCAFLIAVFSAFRLAKFNLDTRQSSKFYGLPTPANTLLIYSIVLTILHDFHISPAYLLQINHFSGWTLALHPALYIVLCLILSLLLIAEIPLLSLKFQKNDPANTIRYFMLALTMVLLGIGALSGYFFLSLLFILFFYVILSLFYY